MQIRGTSSIGATPQVDLTEKASSIENQSSVPQIDTTDQVEISSEAQLIANTQETSGVRSERVAEIRQQIQSGQYETPEKIDAAVERLLDEIA